jgi:hypothetical protein
VSVYSVLNRPEILRGIFLDVSQGEREHDGKGNTRSVEEWIMTVY